MTDLYSWLYNHFLCDFIILVYLPISFEYGHLYQDTYHTISELGLNDMVNLFTTKHHKSEAVFILLTSIFHMILQIHRHMLMAIFLETVGKPLKTIIYDIHTYSPT